MVSATSGAGRSGTGGKAPGTRDDALPLLPAAARRLVGFVAANPDAPLLAAVTGCGGSGKSALLALVAQTYHSAGITVTFPPSRAVSDLGDSGMDSVLLVDDAQTLDTEVLDRLRALAEAEPDEMRLVVAYRPWPRNPSLSALVNVLSRTRPFIVLGNWDADTIAARITRLLDAPPEPELVELVRQQTGGRPRLVDLLVAAVAQAERRGHHSITDAEAPPEVLERLRQDIEAQPDDVRALLLARAVGADSDVDVLAPLLDTTPARVLDAVEGALATGLLSDNGELLPLARQAVLRGTPAARLQVHRQRLAAIYSDRGGSMLGIARTLLGTGASGAGVVAVLTKAGDEAVQESPSLAARLYAEAVAAGAPVNDLATRRAEAHALAGDLDQALRFADQVVADSTAPDRARAAIVAAAIVAHRGLLARSAEIYRWGAAGAPGETARLLSTLAVPPLLGTGASAEARQLLATVESAPTQGPYPTLLAGAASLMARGMYDSVAGSATTALSSLTRAAALLEPNGPMVLLPDTPAALAALVALHCGELDVAASAVERALAADLGGPAARTRHLLLQAWIAVIRGSLEPAAKLLAAAAPPGRSLEPRDELFAAALHVALARRHSDIAGLTRAWQRAREAIVRHPVDLYALQPLGELAIAAGRLGEQRWLEPHLAEAQQLLSRLGNPPLWAAPLHWFAFHAAVTAEQPPQAARHAAALQGAASASAYAGRLATAARCWLRVLAGNIDPPAVEAAARGLHAVGMSWDGSRLAGQAAIRVDNRAAMTALLSCARALQPQSNSGEPPATPASTGRGVPHEASPARGIRRRADVPPPVAAGAGRRAGDGGAAGRGADAATAGAVLSDREREVAALLLAGLTHKQIGERLFISPKTVEHHVSRMRQRFGSPTRGELFSHLRLMLEKR